MSTVTTDASSVIGADGVAKGATMSECTIAFRELAEAATGTHVTTTTTLAPTTIPQTGECNCDGAEWEPECASPGTDPFGGLGCRIAFSLNLGIDHPLIWFHSYIIE